MESGSRGMTGEVQSGRKAKRRYGVVIVGGGIAGCASAYYLAKRGISVLLLEKGAIAGEQSGRNLGFVRQQGRDPKEIAAMMASNRMWRGLEAELEADLGWTQGGVLYAAADEAAMSGYELWLTHARAQGLDSRIVSGREMTALLPGMSREWIGGLYTASDGQADPVATTTAFARAAVRLGADVQVQCAVEGIVITGGGVSGVRTEKGEFETDAVLVAAGAWSGRLLEALRVKLPQLLVCSTVLRTAPAPRLSPLCFWGPDFGFRQRPDGAVIIGAGVRCDHDIGFDSLRYYRAFRDTIGGRKGKVDLHLGGQLVADLLGRLTPATTLRRDLRAERELNPAPVAKKVNKSLDGFRTLFPGLQVDCAQSWAGMIDVTPDQLPAFGGVPNYPGLFVATGFSGHGFGMGPITGRIAAEVIVDGRAPVDLEGFQIDRFAAA